jgi:ABC-type Na+ efflux pump permease subunit
MNDLEKYASPEQLRYAKVLGMGVQVGFGLLVLSFALYLAGVLEPLVPVDQLPKYWGLSAAEFVKVTHTPTGWGWLAEIGRGDMVNLIGIVVLASVSAFSTLAVLPIFARRGETAHLIISALLIVVLIVSASNILALAR